jgi:putative hydrolase of the HAD superfamily
VLAEHGHRVTTDDVRRAWEVADRWFWNEYHRPDNRTWGDDAAIERTWRSYHTLMLGELGFADRAHELLDAILTSQFAPDTWELYPDVEPALAELTSRGDTTVAVLSDWGSNLVGIISGLGLDRYVSFVQASGAIGLAKPDPAFFRAALERADVPAAEAVMVGDTLRADVEGARAAGMEGILLVRPEGPPAREPPPADVRTIASLAELPAIVRGG